MGAFQSICKLSTLMARQSHPVVTKHRGRHCLVCEEIVVPDRLNLFRLGSVRFRRGATENKDHSALIAPSRSNRGSRPDHPFSLISSRVSRPVHFSPSFPFTFPSPGQDGLVSSIDRDKPRENKIPAVCQSIRANNALVHDSRINPGALLSIFPAIRTI